MSKYVDIASIKMQIRNYGKQAIDNGRTALDPVDDIVSIVEALDMIPAHCVAKADGEKDND